MILEMALMFILFPIPRMLHSLNIVIGGFLIW